jgi:hypothetical protein
VNTIETASKQLLEACDEYEQHSVWLDRGRWLYVKKYMDGLRNALGLPRDEVKP